MVGTAKRLLLAAALTVMPAVAADAAQSPVATVRFTSSDAEIPNPERGFYGPLETDLADAALPAISRDYADGYRLLYARIDLADYRSRDLTAALLARLDAGFAAARRGGVKLIVRASYNDPRGETDYRGAQDAPLPQVLRHLQQLRPLYARNQDVIAFVQAGLIGAWGEWHSSSNGLTTPASRNRIKDALLAAVPPDRFVQFRYPPYLIKWVPTLPDVSSALTARFRLGFHNDCFLASRTDVGTFSDDPAVRTRQQHYLSALGAIAPFGGETCNPADDPAATPRTGCDAILSEGASYHLTYLNAGYYRPLFEDRWIANGCMARIKRSMGYRFALMSVSHAARAERGGRLAVTLSVRNDGWARIYNPRSVALVLRDRATGAVQRLAATGSDPRTWLPGTETRAALTAMLPTTLRAGRYDVALALPDADPRLAEDSRYAIRPANADDRAQGQGWDERAGAFWLGTTVTIG